MLHFAWLAGMGYAPSRYSLSKGEREYIERKGGGEGVKGEKQGTVISI